MLHLTAHELGGLNDRIDENGLVSLEKMSGEVARMSPRCSYVKVFQASCTRRTFPGKTHRVLK